MFEKMVAMNKEISADSSRRPLLSPASGGHAGVRQHCPASAARVRVRGGKAAPGAASHSGWGSDTFYKSNRAQGPGSGRAGQAESEGVPAVTAEGALGWPKGGGRGRRPGRGGGRRRPQGRGVSLLPPHRVTPTECTQRKCGTADVVTRLIL